MPLTNPTIQEKLTYTADIEAAQDILEGTFQIDTQFHATELFLSSLEQQLPPTHQMKRYRKKNSAKYSEGGANQ